MGMKEKIRVLHVSPFSDLSRGGQRSMVAMVENMERENIQHEFLMPSEGELMDYLTARGYKCHTMKIKDPFNSNPIKAFRSIKQLNKKIKQGQYDIVHSDGEGDTLAIGFAKLFTKAKSVWHVRVSGKHKNDIWSYRLANRIITISEGVAHRFADQKKNKTLTIFNGVDTEVFKPRNKDETKSLLGLKPDLRYVLFAGQMAKHKGIFDIAQIAASFPEENIKFNLCGEYLDKKTKQEFERRIQDLQNIEHLGVKRNIEMYMAASDMLLLPSSEGKEGMGRVMFEAMACGCVPIAYDISGVRESVTKETGLLVEEGNWKAMADNIKELLSHPEKLEDMQKLGRERAIDVFSIKRHSEKVLSVYEELVMFQKTAPSN
ncbi:MAG: hypothetical protein Kapaf2KO_16250 [Candidatus Kapaibacteriales bacterium]